MTDSPETDFDKKYPTGKRLSRYDSPQWQDDTKHNDSSENSRSREKPQTRQPAPSGPPQSSKPPKQPSKGKSALFSAVFLLFCIGAIGGFLAENTSSDTDTDGVPTIETMCFIEPKPPGLFPENESSVLAQQIRCQLTELSATVGGQICWQLEMRCHNQPTLYIDECRRVPAGEVKVVLLTAQDYPSIDTCERIEGGFTLTKTEVDF